MSEEILVCPVCKSGLNAGVTIKRGGIAKIACPNCGPFVLAHAFHIDYIASARLQKQELAVLSYAIRRMQGSGEVPLLVEESARDILRTTNLPSAIQHIDNLILYLGRILEEAGQTVDLFADDLRAELGVMTATAAQWVLSQALSQDLIQGEDRGDRRLNKRISSATLSLNGWKRFSDLQSSGLRSKRAFMAMPFSKPEIHDAFANCFKPAARRAGFDLQKLDDEPRAGLIDDRLRLEIRTSRFLVADLSDGNQGAYWEAGYAEGLGRPVIYTCKLSVFDDSRTRPHFDTNHYLVVPWDPTDLQAASDLLCRTIRATLPTEALLADG